MKVLKKIVRTREKPEGNMSEGYSLQEAMGFSTEYMKDLKMSIDMYGMMMDMREMQVMC